MNYSFNIYLFLILITGIETIAYILQYQMYQAREKRGAAPALTHQTWLRRLVSVGYVFLIAGPLLLLLLPELPAINVYAPLSLRLAGACICIVASLVGFFAGLVPYLLVRQREIRS